MKRKKYDNAETAPSHGTRFGDKKTYKANKSRSDRDRGYRGDRAGNAPADISDELYDDGETRDPENIIVGRNAVMELLKSGRSVEKILVKEGEREGSLRVICAEALARKIPLSTVGKGKLDRLSGGVVHQGVAAYASAADYCEIEDILARAREKGEKPLILIADEVCDPQNIGAMIRTAECAGAHGMIVPKRRGALIGAAAAKASAGAINYLPIARVPNLASAIEQLKKEGVWIFAAEADGTDYAQCDFDCAAAIVMGGEDTGVSRLVREKCDYIVSLPMYGHVSSLNVSAATAVLLYAASGQQRKKG